jgi:hypothetical protein
MRSSWLAILVAGLASGCGGSSSNPPPNPPAPVPVASVTIGAPSELFLGGTIQLTAFVRDAAGNLLGDVPAWTSDNTAVATVSGAGVATGLATGPVTFTATAGGKSGAFAMKIQAILSGRGTATVDGVLAPNEWAAATTLSLAVSVPGGTTPGKFYVMNDSTNLYLAFSFGRSAGNEINNLDFNFDTDGSGTLNPGDDGLLVSNDVFQDTVMSTASPCPAGAECSFLDSDVGGTNNGLGAFVDSGSTRVFEFMHPLKSGDSNDFALQAGSRIGMFLHLGIIQGGVGTFHETSYPEPFSTFIPLVIH